MADIQLRHWVISVPYGTGRAFDAEGKFATEG